jgi:YD repeat-containing protein
VRSLGIVATLDANGNTLSDAQGRSYTWDFENRLVQATNPGVGTTTFKYDPFGRRIQKSGPLGTTNYLYDGDNLLPCCPNLNHSIKQKSPALASRAFQFSLIAES